MNIVNVKYVDSTTGEIQPREYSYFAEDPLEVGDQVIVPVRGHSMTAIVTAINVPEAEIEAFRDAVKTIPAGAKEIGVGGMESARATIQVLATENSVKVSIADCAAIQEKMAEIYPPSGRTEVVPCGLVEVTRAVVKIGPGHDPAVQNLLGEIMKLREWADKLAITDEPSAKVATNDLTIISRLKKAVEEKRQEYVGPLNAHVKAVNESFKLLTGPLEELDRLARKKVEDYKIAAIQKARRAEELNQQIEEIAREQAKLSGTGEFTVDTTPVVVPPPVKTTRAEIGSSGLTDCWTYEIVDPNLIPREFMLVDTAMLNMIAKKHHDQKPVAGVRFFNKPTLSVRGK